MTRVLLATRPGDRYVLIRLRDGRGLIAPEAEWWRWQYTATGPIVAAGTLEAMQQARLLLTPDVKHPLPDTISVTVGYAI